MSPECRNLIREKRFFGQKTGNSTDIVKKARGVPLAIINVVGALKCKRKTFGEVLKQLQISTPRS